MADVENAEVAGGTHEMVDPNSQEWTPDSPKTQQMKMEIADLTSKNTVLTEQTSDLTSRCQLLHDENIILMEVARKARKNKKVFQNKLIKERMDAVDKIQEDVIAGFAAGRSPAKDQTITDLKDVKAEMAKTITDLKAELAQVAGAAPVDGISVGSSVTWESSDVDIPTGHKGEVLGITEDGRLLVKFPNGTWKNSDGSQQFQLVAVAPQAGGNADEVPGMQVLHRMHAGQEFQVVPTQDRRKCVEVYSSSQNASEKGARIDIWTKDKPDIAGKIFRFLCVDGDGFGCLEARSVAGQDKFITSMNLDNADVKATAGVRQRDYEDVVAAGKFDTARWMPIDFQADNSFRLQSCSYRDYFLTVFGGTFNNGTGMCVHNEKADNSLFYAEFV